MTRLVEDLLATARRDAAELADADVNLAMVAREAGEDFAVLATERGVRLSYVLRADLELIGDHDALRRAAGNLLSNAVRHTPPGATITLATGHTDGWHWLAVADHGPGIPDEDQPRIFDRFWRQPGTDPAGGRDRHAGLGLAIVRQITESPGGRAAVFSTPGTGSTFVLWFPARDRPDTGTPPEANPLSTAR